MQIRRITDFFSFGSERMSVFSIKEVSLKDAI